MAQWYQMSIVVHWGMKHERNAGAVGPLSLFSFLLFADAVFICLHRMNGLYLLSLQHLILLPSIQKHSQQKGK